MKEKIILDELNAPPQIFGRTLGKVVSARGNTLTAEIPSAILGEICEITLHTGATIQAQVVAFDQTLAILAPIQQLSGVSPGSIVKRGFAQPRIKISDRMRGRIIGALGEALDGGVELQSDDSTYWTQLINPPPHPLKRRSINTPLVTGISSIDALCTIGHGQRIGLFAPAGVGKSTLLGQIAKNSDVDTVVIALIGERGREIRSFIEENLGPEGRSKAVVVVSTSDETSVKRYLSALTATAIAEHFRDKGEKVLLLFDSLTRTARALREIGLNAGEIPVRHGYTPSVYNELPRLLERAGCNEKGSITAIYTVLTERDHMMDPLTDEVKSILDGHIVLSNDVLRDGIRPSIDQTESISRLFTQLHNSEYQHHADNLRYIITRLKTDRDILLFGGTPSADLKICMELAPEIRRCLAQEIDQFRSFEDSTQLIRDISTRFKEMESTDILS